MRAFKSRLEPDFKKPPLDIVEVVSDLVDLTVISDDDDGKSDKKAKKADEKRKQRERMRAELRKAHAAQKRAAKEERLQREVAAEARRKADEAALRAAARRDGYDRGIVRAAPGSPCGVLEPTPPSLPGGTAAPPEPAAAEAAARGAKRARGAGGTAGALGAGAPPAEPAPSALAATASARAPPPVPADPPVPAAPVPAAPVPAKEAAAAAVARPRAVPEGGAPPAPEAKLKDLKAALLARKGPSMAEAIAAAQKEQSAVSSGFASFEVFDAQASHEKAHGLETEEFDPDDEDDINPEGLLPVELYALQDLPEELRLEDIGSEPGLYVAHYIRYVLGAWQRMLASGQAIDSSSLTNQTAALFQSREKFQSTAEALKPLLRQLRLRKLNEEMLGGLETVVKLAAEREYNRANSEYVGMTMGRKTWHNSLPCFQQQQNHGGSVRKIIKQSELMDFDWDPTVQAYMYALKRVIQFAQCIRPPDDPAKCA